MPIEISYENRDFLEVKLDWLNIEVVPNCYALNPSSAELYSESGLVSPLISPSITIDRSTETIDIQNDSMILGLRTFFFSIAANDSLGTTDMNPSIEYQVTFIDSCLSNSILALVPTP